MEFRALRDLFNENNILIYRKGEVRDVRQFDVDPDEVVIGDSEFVQNYACTTVPLNLTLVVGVDVELLKGER